MCNLISFDMNFNRVVLKLSKRNDIKTCDRFVEGGKDLINLTVTHNSQHDKICNQCGQCHVDNKRPFRLPPENGWV